MAHTHRDASPALESKPGPVEVVGAENRLAAELEPHDAHACLCDCSDGTHEPCERLTRLVAATGIIDTGF